MVLLYDDGALFFEESAFLYDVAFIYDVALLYEDGASYKRLFFFWKGAFYAMVVTRNFHSKNLVKELLSRIFEGKYTNSVSFFLA